MLAWISENSLKPTRFNSGGSTNMLTGRGRSLGFMPHRPGMIAQIQRFRNGLSPQLNHVPAIAREFWSSQRIGRLHRTLLPAVATEAGPCDRPRNGRAVFINSAGVYVHTTGVPSQYAMGIETNRNTSSMPGLTRTHYLALVLRRPELFAGVGYNRLVS